MSFRVGQRVVCVDESVECRNGFPACGLIRKGATYIVRGVGIANNGEIGLRLNGVVLSSGPGHIGITTHKPFVDAFYRAARFRPITEQSTDAGMAILRQILADHKAPEREKTPPSFRVTGT